MADVRALLAAERASRQIKHPHLSYSKTGALTCNICNLNIKSEQLWPGHQKSAAHRKNVQRTSEQPIRPAKRKIESLEDDVEEQNKKRKSFEDTSRTPEVMSEEPLLGTAEPKSVPQVAPTNASMDNGIRNAEIESGTDKPPPEQNPTATVDGVDEDEWAAFERDVAPLALPDYTAATIEAAPVSAAELAEQQKVNPVQQREDEAEAEKEEESRRLEEEFEVMEEMEDRVKRLRDRREALRSGTDSMKTAESVPPLTKPIIPETKSVEADSSDDEDDDDGWYN